MHIINGRTQLKTFYLLIKVLLLQTAGLALILVVIGSATELTTTPLQLASKLMWV